MGKRKRNGIEGNEKLPLPAGEAKKKKVAHREGATTITIQIIIGTYEKVLHGITASIVSGAKGDREPDSVEFADTFLLNAHTSAIRCLAVRIYQSILLRCFQVLHCKTCLHAKNSCTFRTSLIAQAVTVEATLIRRCA